MRSILIGIAVLFMAVPLVQAQIGAKSPELFLNATVHQGKVRLRWAPANFSAFQQGNQYGYQLSRRLVATGNTVLSAAQQEASHVVLGLFKPLPEASWTAIADTNELAGVAQGAIYADDFTVGPNGGDAFYEASNKKAQRDNRFGFGLYAADLSYNVAQWMGLAYVDQTAATAQPAGEYVYIVKLMLPDSTKRPRSSLNIRVDGTFPLPAPEGLKADASPNKVLLTLPRGALDQYYSSYNIERSANNGATWQQRNSKALVFLDNEEDNSQMIFGDTIEQQGVAFKYRIRGKSPFGILGLPSNVAEATAPIPPLGIYPDLQSITENAGDFQLAWTFPAAKNGNIQRFEIWRSDNADGGFTKLADLAVTARTYTDTDPGQLSNYYKVIAIDQGSNPNESLAKLAQLDDKNPPTAPLGLAASVDKSGLVSLAWEHNTELDLKGYRVFFANNPDDHFAQLTQEVLKENTFKHQLELKVLGKKVYYKILATDLRENDSPLSAAVFVDRPDVIPPAQPVLNKVDPMPIGVVLQWTPSGSDDLARHEVQRKVKNTTTWQTVASFPQGSPVVQLTDSTHTGISEYSYRVLAFDQGGLASSSSVIDVKPQRTNVDTIMEFKVFTAVEGMQKQAKLQWEYKGDSGAAEFHIYRGKATGQPIFYATHKVKKEDLVIDPVTKRATFFYRDKTIDPGEQYRYRVLAKFSDGSSSPLSVQQPFVY